MKNSITTIASMAILLWCSTASAYTKIFFIDFSPGNTKGRSNVVSTSPGTEAAQYDRLKTIARLYEEGNQVDADFSTGPTRVNQESVSRVSIAEDNSLSEGCNYCNDNSSAVNPALISSITSQLNSSNIDGVDTFTDPEFKRCEVFDPYPD